MYLIISAYIKKHEFKHTAKYFSLGDIKKAIQKIASSGITISNLGYKDAKIVKVRLGHKPAGRMIIFVQLKKNYYIPIVIRLKKDKIFGENLSLSNQKAVQKILDNLEYVFQDLRAGAYEKYEL